MQSLFIQQALRIFLLKFPPGDIPALFNHIANPSF